MSTFRFTLIDDKGKITFGSNRVENWEEVEQSLTRSKKYRGRVREVSNTFVFVKDIRARFISNLDRNSLNADAKILVEKGNDNKEEFSYIPVGNPFYMKADFGSVKITELTFEINFLDSKFNEDISQREKEKLNITLDKALDGADVSSYADLLRDISMYDSTLLFNSDINYLLGTVNAWGTYSITINGIGNEITTVLGNEVIYKSDSNIKTVVKREQDSLNVEDLFYLISEKARDLNINYNFHIGAFALNGDTHAKFTIKRYNGEDYDFVDEIVLYEGDLPLNGGTEDTIVSGSLVIPIKEGDSLLLSIDATVVIYAREASLFVWSDEYYPPTESKCILPHDFFNRWIYLMTGVENGFYSEYLGLKSDGYSEDGEGAYIAIMDGHMIRNLPIEEKPLNTRFKDIVIDFIKLKNLVAWIEYRGSEEVFRIEPWSELYSQDVAVDLGELIAEPERKIDKEETYSLINVGYKDEDPEALNGLNIFNGESNYSIPIKGVDKELDLKLKSITASEVIELTRRTQANEFPEKDTNYDKKIFLVDAKPASYSDRYLYAKKDEDFSFVEGIRNPTTAYNLNLTPARILEAWKPVISEPLTVISGEIIHTKGASEANLVTQRNDETEPIYENGNVDISSLPKPLFINEILSVKDAPITDEQNTLINENPNKLVKFTNKGIAFYGMSNQYNFEAAFNKGNFELKRSNR